MGIDGIEGYEGCRVSLSLYGGFLKLGAPLRGI